MTAHEYCKQDLELNERRLADLKAGRLRFGTSIDGYTWIETTADDIAHTEARITELKRVLEAGGELL
jgi:hypothetical protein